MIDPDDISTSDYDDNYRILEEDDCVAVMMSQSEELQPKEIKMNRISGYCVALLNILRGR